jgi:tRNA pseudouridine55 synthase
VANPSVRQPRRAIDGIVLLDKPLGLSSNAALQRVKRLYRAEKAGHTGALDPLATGLLPICLGEATKLSAYLLDADKTYRATVRVGLSTETGDAEGLPVRQSDPALLDRAGLEAVMPRFLGEILQIPPMYSALKRDGRPLYELARAGLEVERAARPVAIHSLKVLEFGGAQFSFEVHCSKGTYVRTLAEDWAAAAGQAAHLVGLRRQAAGPFDESRMLSLEVLEKAAEESLDALDHQLLTPAAAVAGWPQVVADPAAQQRLVHGQAVTLSNTPTDGLVAVMDPAGRLLGLAEIDPAGRVAPKRWLTRVSP